MPSSALVCLFVGRIMQNKTARPTATKLGEKVTHEPREKPLDLSGYPDFFRLMVTVGLGLRLGTLRQSAWGCVT